MARLSFAQPRCPLYRPEALPLAIGLQSNFLGIIVVGVLARQGGTTDPDETRIVSWAKPTFAGR